MTAILAIFANDGATADEALVTRMLDRMGSRGGARASIWREGGAVIAITRHEWEFGPGFSGPVLIVQDGDHVIAADASLYYKDDLRRKLADKGVRPKGQTPSHLILAAYQAFGEKCAEMLEGDFSFVIWDRRTKRVVAARDFGGKRPLHFAELKSGRTIVFASSIGALTEHPMCGTELDLFAIGGVTANLWSPHDHTCYAGVKVAPAAHTVTVDINSRAGVQITRHWTPPTFHGQSVLPFEAAAEELRELLCAATNERMATDGSTCVWLSGGADSPAVFASGSRVLVQKADGRRLLPVSISYPVGDRGREDELIQAIADRWQMPVHWIDSRTIPIFSQPARRAAHRDEPFAHAFEMWNRALANGARSVGAQISLDGNGGDQLFYASDYYLADLLRNGSLRTLRSQLRTKGQRSNSDVWSNAIQPLIPPSLRTLGRALALGSFVSAPFEKSLPPWIESRFAKCYQLIESERAANQRLKGETLGAFEARWFLTQQYFPRIFSLISQFALESGVESRSPLYDRRIIEFAATRPRSERASGRQTKRLLRHAMRGLLPDHVIAPRAYKTGLTSGFFSQGMSGRLSSLVANLFHGGCRLAALGVVDPRKVRSAADEYERTHLAEAGISLFTAVQTELWLQAREIRADPDNRRTYYRVPVLAEATNAA